MTVSLSDQFYVLSLSLLMGAALGVLYDVFKVLRLVGLNGAVIVFFEDILFFAISTVTVFSFYMQVTDGKFRVYPLIFAGVGFALYFLTLEKIVFFVVKKIYGFLTLIFGFVYKKIVLFVFLKLARFAKFVLRPIRKIFHSFFKENLIIFLKKLLPKRRILLYNKLWSKTRGKGRRQGAENRQEADKKAFFC